MSYEGGAAGLMRTKDDFTATLPSSRGTSLSSPLHTLSSLPYWYIKAAHHGYAREQEVTGDTCHPTWKC
jgi:hypothetical protein